MTIVIMGLYELMVRRWNVLRVLFGMKPVARPAVERAQAGLTINNDPIPFSTGEKQ